MTWRPQLW